MFVPLVVSCPGCHASIAFNHDATNIKPCTCGTVISRTSTGIKELSPRIIQNAGDIIQPGTTGKWDGKEFKVLGRVRAWMEEFVINYWTIVLADRDVAYLVEGYGLYAIHQNILPEKEIIISSLAEIKVGGKRDLYKGITYLLERTYRCYRWELEGEVQFPGEEDLTIYEFAAASGDRVEIMNRGNKNFTYHVHYVSFDSLQLTNTRAYSRTPLQVPCKKCQQDNVVQTFPYAQSFACMHCGSQHSLRNGNEFVAEKLNKVAGETSITLWSKGKIKGIEYEVLGVAIKEELNEYRSQWKEYTLYNPAFGYSFLSEFNGNWLLVKETGNAPVVMHDVDKFEFDKEDFLLYNRYSFETVGSVGEFPYNIFNDHTKKVKEFISPPEIWIQEAHNKEGIVWFFGEHISTKEIKQAFGANVILPSKIGVGAVEPRGYVNPFKIATVALFAIILIFFVHALTVMGSEERPILQANLPMRRMANEPHVTDKFYLDKWRSNLRFDIQAPVHNDWFELGATLVNLTTGKEYSISEEVEYYTGYEDGSRWTEGSQHQTGYMSQVPEGLYVLHIYGYADTRSAGAVSSPNEEFSLNVTYDTPMHRNAIYCIVAIVLWGFLHFLLIRHYEVQRWSNSPFSPYDEE